MNLSPQPSTVADGSRAAGTSGLTATAALNAAPRRSILFSAYTISPVQGSEPAAGWEVATRLARYHDVTVLCSSTVEGEDNREQIETYLRQHGPVRGLRFHYVTPPRLSRWLQRSSGSPLRPLYYVGYAAWQRNAYRAARRLEARIRFDLVHQFNLSGYREPGYLWRLGLPFVWGPIGGASNVPWPYFTTFTARERLFYATRNLVNRLHLTMGPTSRRCRRAAAVARTRGLIWSIGANDCDMVERHWRTPSQRMLDSGAMVRAEARLREYDGGRPLRLAWSGVHIGRKALPILLEAMARLKAAPAGAGIELVVLGNGPQTARWQALASRLGVANRVKWAGHLPHAQAVAHVAEADLFVHTSLLEGTPHVVLEALSLGVPVLCHDACGMGAAVDQRCGGKVPLRDVATSVEGFAAWLGELATAPDRLRELSRGALLRAGELSWDRKVNQIVTGYEAVLNATARQKGHA